MGANKLILIVVLMSTQRSVNQNAEYFLYRLLFQQHENDSLLHIFYRVMHVLANNQLNNNE
ncbi:hypothetical protein PMI27_000121 [Pseudomonas sp. GM41(2012)]|jgi:hypothetical protein|nr:hypothetical protein PMI27_000121 [Pseudomonas sp. GM41(2012)]